MLWWPWMMSLIVNGVNPWYALSKYTFAPDGEEVTEIEPTGSTPGPIGVGTGVSI